MTTEVKKRHIPSDERKPRAYTGALHRNLPRLPTAVRYALWIIVPLTWIPLALAFMGMQTRSEIPRRVLFMDMGTQPRYNPQAVATIFADNRAMRPVVEGTVARGQLELDDHYYRGFTSSTDASGRVQFTFLKGYPSQVKVDEPLLLRGQNRFNIYCSTCHGYTGDGRGPIRTRTEELGSMWNISSLHDPTIVARPEGHIFNTITHGIRTMPSYAAQISVEDRWAIVAYVRALQLSQRMPQSSTPREIIDRLPTEGR